MKRALQALSDFVLLTAGALALVGAAVVSEMLLRGM